jgi:hypothetical protein
MKPKIINPWFKAYVITGKIPGQIICQLNFLSFLLVLVLFFQSCTGIREGEKVLGIITVKAGDYDRIDTPVRYECNLADILGDISKVPGLNDHHLMLYEFDSGRSKFPVQWEPKTGFAWEKNDNEGALVWILDDVTGKGSERKFRLVLKAGPSQEDPFSIQDINNTSLLIKSADRPVLQYNYGIIREKEGQEGIFDKSSYIHPVWTPKGEIITGDFSPEHIWQRGIFLAWQKVKFGDVETNFWELGNATGRTLKDDNDPDIIKGQVFTELVVHNKGTVEGRTYFKEKCIIRLYNRPEHDNWMFDITFRQWPVDPENPDKLPGESMVMELQKVYYGGMSFRGVSPGWLHYDFIARNKEHLAKFNKDTRWMNPADSLDILTSEGFGRKKGNATPARWIDYTGPLGERWGGLIMLDHPSNIRYPAPLRIHPEMPYFCFAFTKDNTYSITSESPLQLTYRIVVHNGRPDRDYNERVARDFTDPPKARWRKGE